jgi:hypothetical protein
MPQKPKVSIAPSPGLLDRMFSFFSPEPEPPGLPSLDVNLPDETDRMTLVEGIPQGIPREYKDTYFSGGFTDPRWGEWNDRIQQQRKNQVILQQQKNRVFDSVTLNPTKRTG